MDKTKKERQLQASRRWKAKNPERQQVYREANRERDRLRDRETAIRRLIRLGPAAETENLWCTGCQTNKAVELFSRNCHQRSGRNNWCKVCCQKLQGRPEYAVRRRDKRDADWPHALTIECRLRAKKRGLPFDITKDDLIVPEFCPVLGIPLRPKQGKRADDGPSVDRIDPVKGYVRGNVAVISWLANRIKSDCADPAVFEAIAAYIRWGLDAGSANRPGLRMQAAVQGVP
jgi:hypothetical protein